MAALAVEGIAPEVQRVLRFGCVGLLGVAVNTALLWLLTERIQLYYVVSSVLATEISILANFSLNHVWTFAALNDGESVIAKLAKYNIVALGGLLLSVTTLFVLTALLPVHYLFANLVAIGTGTLWNYSASRRWAWRTPVAVPWHTHSPVHAQDVRR